MKSIIKLICFLFIGINLNAQSVDGKLRVICFNFLEGGQGGLEGIFDTLDAKKADIVLCQETVVPGNEMAILAQQRGYYYYQGWADPWANPYERAILSKFPIIEARQLKSKIVEAKIEISPGNEIYVYNAHFRPLEMNPERVYEMRQVVEERLRDKRLNYPVIFGGDLNVWSHQSNVLGQPLEIGFQLLDTYDRFDYLYAANFDEVPNSGEMLGGAYGNFNPGWPSDHLAIYEELYMPVTMVPENKNSLIAIKGFDTYTFSDTNFTNNYFLTDLQSIRIDELPEKGLLKLNGTLLGVGSQVNGNEFANLTYESQGIGYDEIAWSGFNGAYTKHKAFIQFYVDSVVTNLSREIGIVDIDFLTDGVDLINGGSDYFIDEGQTEFEDAFFIKMAINLIQTWTTDSLVTFDLKKHGTLYIAYDERVVGPPDWLTNNFTRTDIPFKSSVHNYVVYERLANNGPIVLGKHSFDWNQRSSIDAYIPIIKPTGSVLMVPEAIEFGSARSGDVISKEVNISNFLGVSSTLESAILPKYFSIDAELPTTISDGGQLNVPIQFNCPGSGHFNGPAKFIFDTGDTLIIDLKAKGTNFSPRGVYESFDDNSLHSGYEEIGNFSLTESNGELKVEGSGTTGYQFFRVSFPPVDVFENRKTGFRVKNPGPEELTIKMFPISVDNNTVNYHFNPEYIIPGNTHDYVDITYEFQWFRLWDGTPVDSSAIAGFFFEINMGRNFSQTFYLDDLWAGTPDLLLSPLEDNSLDFSFDILNNSVRFNPNASENVADLEWDFGDGVHAKGVANPTHSYKTVGEFNVCLTGIFANQEIKVCQTINIEDIQKEQKERNKIISPHRKEGEEFGWDTDETDNWVFVGAPESDTDTNNQNEINASGAVYIYRKTAQKNLNFHQKLVLPNREGNSGSRFGSLLSANENKLIVLSPGSNEILAFEFNEQKQKWEWSENLSASGLNVNEISNMEWMDEQKIAFGAPFHDLDINNQNHQSNAGAVYVFENNNGSWAFSYKLVSPMRMLADNFGSSLAFSNGRLLVSSPNFDFDVDGNFQKDNTGAIYIFKDQTLEVSLVEPDRGREHKFGSKLIAGDSIIYVWASGASQFDGENWNMGSGNLYQYIWDGSSIRLTQTFHHNKFGQNWPLNIAAYKDQLIMTSNLSSELWRDTVQQMVYSGFYNNADVNGTNGYGVSTTVYENSILVGAHLDDFDAMEDNFLNDAGAIYYYRPCPTRVSVMDTNLCPGDTLFIGQEFVLDSGNFEVSIVLPSGCDSTVRGMLNYFPSVSDSSSVQICQGDSSYFDGQWFKEEGFYSAINQSINGCDSSYYLDLELLLPDTSEMNYEMCLGDSIEINGGWYYSDTLWYVQETSSQGCDSVIEHELIVEVFNLEISRNQTTLTSEDLNAATYQWIDCDSEEPIVGANNSSYDVTQNGTYAVILEKNGCTDTSECITVADFSIESLSEMSLVVWPNPAVNKIYLDGLGFTQIEIMLMDNQGKVLKHFEGNNITEINVEDLAPGYYFIHVRANEDHKRIPIVKVQ